MALTFGVDTPCRGHRGPECPACAGSGIVRSPQAIARRDDPLTSVEAAASVNVTKGRAYVLGLLLKHGPMTDQRLVELAQYELSDSGARTRRHELTGLGLVADTGERVTLPSGRRAIVWAAVEAAK